MAGIFDWSATPASNSTVDGINVADGCPAGNMNNAVRSTMALIRQSFNSTLANFLAGASPLALANGGTGGADAATARTNLSAAARGANSDITSLSGLTTAITIAQGGTGATTAAAARAALAAAGVTASSFAAASGYVTFDIGGTAFKLQWKDASISANATISVTYPSAYSSWSRAWVSGGENDASAYQNAPHIVDGSASTTGCQVVNGYDSGATNITVFCIGV